MSPFSLFRSDSNLRRDKFLIMEQAKTTEGWVGIATLLTFKKLQAITTDPAVVVASCALGGVGDLLTVRDDHAAVRAARLRRTFL